MNQARPISMDFSQNPHEFKYRINHFFPSLCEKKGHGSGMTPKRTHADHPRHCAQNVPAEEHGGYESAR
jgi:hypothetical protein